MKRKIKPAEARKMLGRAPSQVGFWLCSNQMIYSLSALEKALAGADDDVFRYHVNRDKNDFEQWIREIIKDKELAREIARIKTRETLIRKINERIEELRKALKKPAKRLTKRKTRKVKRKAAQKARKKQAGKKAKRKRRSIK